MSGTFKQAKEQAWHHVPGIFHLLYALLLCLAIVIGWSIRHVRSWFSRSS